MNTKIFKKGITILFRRDDKSDDGKTIRDIFQPYYLLTDLTPGTLYRVHVAAMRDGRESSSVDKTFGTGTLQTNCKCMSEKWRLVKNIFRETAKQHDMRDTVFSPPLVTYFAAYRPCCSHWHQNCVSLAARRISVKASQHCIK